MDSRPDILKVEPTGLVIREEDAKVGDLLEVGYFGTIFQGYVIRYRGELRVLNWKKVDYEAEEENLQDL